MKNQLTTESSAYLVSFCLQSILEEFYFCLKSRAAFDTNNFTELRLRFGLGILLQGLKIFNGNY